MHPDWPGGPIHPGCPGLPGHPGGPIIPGGPGIGGGIGGGQHCGWAGWHPPPHMLGLALRLAISRTYSVNHK
jgi:hypothetical protein